MKFTLKYSTIHRTNLKVVCGKIDQLVAFILRIAIKYVKLYELLRMVLIQIEE